MLFSFVLIADESVEDVDNYNAYPTQQLPIIKKDEDSLTLTNYHWGLIPKWSEKMTDFRPLNNARLETLMAVSYTHLRAHET